MPKKISGLTQETTFADDDNLVFSDSSAGLDKRISGNDIRKKAAAFAVDNVSGLIALTQTDFSTGDKVEMLGFYAAGDGGGGVLYWDSTEDKANHNGGTIIDPDHSITPGSAGWWTDENTGTGCFKRELGHTISAICFGVKPGSTDSSPAVQAIVDDHPGVIIVFPRDDYTFDEITISSLDGVTILGNGSTINSTLTANGNSKNYFTISSSSNITISDFILDGGSGGSTTIISESIEARAIECSNSDRLIFSNITVQSWRTGFESDSKDPACFYMDGCTEIILKDWKLKDNAQEGIVLYNSDNITIKDGIIDNLGYTTISLGDCSKGVINNIKCTNTSVNGASNSLLNLGGEDLEVSSCSFVEHGSTFTGDYTNSAYGSEGINFHSGSTSYKNVIIKDCYFEKMNSCLYRTATITVENVLFEGNTCFDIYESISALSNSSNVKILNNTFIQNARGINVQQSTSNDINDWRVEGNEYIDISSQGVLIGSQSAGGSVNRPVVKNNFAYNTAFSGSQVYRIEKVNDGLIANNYAMTGGGGDPAYHYLLQNDTGYLYVRDNISIGSASTSKYSFGGNNSAGRKIKYNVGYTTENYGKSSQTTGGDGGFDIVHGLADTPTYITLGIEGDNTYEAVIQSADGTNIRCRVRNTTDNSDVTSTSVTVYWEAKL